MLFIDYLNFILLMRNCEISVKAKRIIKVLSKEILRVKLN